MGRLQKNTPPDDNKFDRLFTELFQSPVTNVLMRRDKHGKAIKYFFFEPIMNNKLSDLIIIFFVSIFVFLVGTAQQEIITFDARFYLFALEMWRHGISWFPTTYQVPYPDYPPLSTWLIYAAAKIFGGLNKTIALLPTALAAAVTVCITYLLGALQARRWGWYAAGFMLFTNAFIMSARSISLDVFVMAFTAGSFYLAYAQQLKQKKMPLFSLLVLLAASFFVRGPIGLIIPTGVLCVFYLFEKNIKACFILGCSAFVVLMVCSGILLTMAYHVGGTTFMHQVLMMEVVGRMQQIQTPDWWFYLTESIGAYAVTYPLALLILVGLAPRLIQRNLSQEMKFIRLLFGWLLIILVGLSLTADKKIRYILAIMPALALISAYLFANTPPNLFLRVFKMLFSWIFKLFPTIASVSLLLLNKHHVPLNYPILMIGLTVGQFFIFLFWRKEWVFFIAVLTFDLYYMLVVEKINYLANQTKSFVMQVETLRLHQHAKLVFFREGNDGTVIKYLVDMPQEGYPIFINQPQQIPANAFVITAKENFPALGHLMQIVAQGKIGHDDYVVSKAVLHP